MRKEVQNWMEQSLAERRTANNCHKAGDFYAAVFHAQQTMELSLKALHIFKKNELPPKTHSLIELAEKLKIPLKFIKLAKELTPAYTLTRYPDIAGSAPYKLYSQDTSRQFLNELEEFLKWLQDNLKE